MNPSDDPREELVPGTFSATEDIAELKAQMQEMQMQIDILKETINVLKKTPASIRQLSGTRRRQRLSMP